MADHHPDALGDVAWAVRDAMQGPSGSESWAAISAAVLDALAAAGLAVVKVGEPPPWMEHARNHKYEQEGAYMAGTFCGWVDEEADDDGRCADGFYRPLYVIKEQDRD